MNACQAVTPNSELLQGIAETIPLRNLMNVLLSLQLVSSAVQKILWMAWLTKPGEIPPLLLMTAILISEGLNYYYH